MKNLFFYTLFFLLINHCLTGQYILWEHSYGGSGIEQLKDVIPTTDGGYLLGGTSSSMDGDLANGTYGYTDYWVVKTDANGGIEWEQNYGGSSFDNLESIIQTTDGGYLLGGWARSSDGDVGGTGGRYDYWIVKLDVNGNIEWEKDYGSLQWEELAAVIQTADGGYMIGGFSDEASGDVSSNNGAADYWIVKIDASGNIEWEQNYGSTISETLTGIVQTADGGYMLGGSTVGGNNDYWMIKIDANGNIEWDQYYGGYAEGLEAFIQTNDGGYLLSGWVIVNGNYNALNGWIVKIDANGNIEWDQVYGGSGRDYLYSVVQLDDGSYLLTGSSNSTDFMGHIGNYDALLIKIDANGNIEWSEKYGGTNTDIFRGIVIDANGDFVAAGNSSSNDIDVANNNANDANAIAGYWVVKISKEECIDNLTLDASSSLETEYRAANLIETIGNISITSTDVVTFKSNETILNQAFEVQPNGVFCIYNAPCGVTIPVQNRNMK